MMKWDDFCRLMENTANLSEGIAEGVTELNRELDEISKGTDALIAEIRGLQLSPAA